MIREIDSVREDLRSRPLRWLVTGGAGFIGSHLVHTLLLLEQEVVCLDNFSTGYRRNLDEVRDLVGPASIRRLRVLEADIRDLSACRSACKGMEIVLHQAALGSVPRSVQDPLATNATNVDGFLNMLVATRDAGARRFVYAASSSTYGDDPKLPKIEDRIGQPLSPYAVTKLINELYAAVFARTYGMETIGLRYFNVFGARQDPEGPYAAVIPRWIRSMITGEKVVINGDGETSRDFCYIENAVQANLLAAVTTKSEAINQVYNVAVGDRTTLNQLFIAVRDELARHVPTVAAAQPEHGKFRPGDVRHSQADVAKAQRCLGYSPALRLREGLEIAMPWYATHFGTTHDVVQSVAART